MHPSSPRDNFLSYEISKSCGNTGLVLLFSREQLYSPYGELYCFAVVFGKSRVIFALRVLKANIISLLRKQKYHYAKGHNITLCEAQNITKIQPRNHHGFRGFLFALLFALVQTWCKFLLIYWK